MIKKKKGYLNFIKWYKCTKYHLIIFNGTFNVNLWSNLILTIRLPGEVTMNKKARARKKFIHCDHSKRDFWERRRKRRERVFEEILNQEREFLGETKKKERVRVWRDFEVGERKFQNFEVGTFPNKFWISRQS